MASFPLFLSQRFAAGRYRDREQNKMDALIDS